MSRNYKIVSIEGNIGSGKSTLLEKIRKEYSTNPQVIFLKEPVEEWEKIKDKSGNTMLKKFYIDQNKYSFAFQMMAYISRLKILRDTIKSIKDNKSMTNLASQIIVQGVFFNWASPEYAKCWPASN